MINLSPIHYSIRNTLSNKARAVSRNFEGDTLDSKSKKLQNAFTKAIWVKMFSPVDSTMVTRNMGSKDRPDWINESGMRKGMKTATILGGETKGISSNKSETMLTGFDSVYTPRTGTKTGGLENSPGALKRPMAGIKDISISYKGALSAIRIATINWVCWTFEDLERFLPHFMSHGKGVLIEWGYSIPEVIEEANFGSEDMMDGTAYSNLQDRIIKLEGNYDAMAGIITNWEWSLRDDGGFDCMTKLVSRGVNILDGDISGTATGRTPVAGDKVSKTKNERDLTPGEFVEILRENITSLCTEADSWWNMGPARRRGHSQRQNWDKKGNRSDGEWKKLQPPGTLYLKIDNFWSNPKGGPWVSWGWMEDNIISKFIGRYERDSGRVVNSFRSLEPILANATIEGSYKLDNKGGITSDVYKARFESVKIRNSEWLLTPDMNRWILPGNKQFYVEHVGINKAEGWTNSLQIMQDLGEAVNDENTFKPFAVDGKDPNKGGYLRNIILSYDLITKSFKNADTIKQGMGNLFNELNKDVGGYWSFELVDDPYISGNVKVVDMSRTTRTPGDLLDDNKAEIKKGKKAKPPNDEFGNPGSEMFVFPSWGEKSIVKSQTLTSKVPSSMAVSAMYAGTAPPGKEGENSTIKGQATAKLTGAGGVDLSQENIVFAGRISSNNVFGSLSPWGPGADGQFMSDGQKDTTIPSAKEADEIFSNPGGAFGPNFGIPFTDVKYQDFLEKITKNKKATDTEKKKAQEDLDKEVASSVEADYNFHRLHPKGNPGHVKHTDANKEWKDTGSYVKIVLHLITKLGFLWMSRDDEESLWLYRMDGILTLIKGFPIYIYRSMLDYIHGNGLTQTLEERLEQAGDPIVPIDLEITIDGIGGIIPGNAFHVDYIPEVYKNNCVFQALKVEHSVSSAGWTTTITGQPRVAMKKLLEEQEMI